MCAPMWLVGIRARPYSGQVPYVVDTSLGDPPSAHAREKGTDPRSGGLGRRDGEANSGTAYHRRPAIPPAITI